jgi:hypothetical protein
MSYMTGVTRWPAKREVHPKGTRGCKPSMMISFGSLLAAPRGYPAAKSAPNRSFWERLHLSQTLTRKSCND